MMTSVWLNEHRFPLIDIPNSHGPSRNAVSGTKPQQRDFKRAVGGLPKVLAGSGKLEAFLWG